LRSHNGDFRGGLSMLKIHPLAGFNHRTGLKD